MKKSKILAFVCALAVGASATGCANTSWSIKSGNITMPAGVYLYYLLNNASSVEEQAQQSAAASSSSTSSSASSQPTDPWAQTIDKVSASTWAINNALTSTKEMLVIEQECATRKITLSSSEASDAKSQADSNYSQYSTMFSKNGISQTSLERLSTDMALSQKLFDSYYSTGGDKAVSESDLDSYYTKNFVHVKQIFVSKTDTSTNEALTGDKLAAATKKANEAYAAAKADPAKFDDYVKQYNEDPGMQQNPDGYILSKTTAANQGFDQKFTDLAFSLKEGAVGMAESDMGYFIEMKVATDPKASSFSTEKETVLQEMKGSDYQSLLQSEAGKVKVQQNSSMINHYNPKKMDLTQD